MINLKNRVLIAIDVSNIEYASIYSAVKYWRKNHRAESDGVFQPIYLQDQSNLPNLLNYESFRRELREAVQRKLSYIMWMAKNHHQNEIDTADDVDVIMTEDDRLANNFRRKAYPEYKAHRKLVKQMYDIFAIKDFIRNVIFPELEIEKKYGYKMIRVEDCESDDIIAILMRRFPDYMCRILFSSDRDFLQLENVYQYNMNGERIKRVTFKDALIEEEVSPNDYLLWKILNGDTSDNIKGVFPKYGPKKCYKLVKNKAKIKEMLKEDLSSVERFKLNKLLIDFDCIPKDVEEKIYNKIYEKLSEIKEPVNEITAENCIIS